jgi:putative restriction endonuclease
LEGADSIVVSGGYEDDEDYGDVIIYTGHGGNDPETGKQIADQKLDRGKLALLKSRLEGLPVRVVRGAHDRSQHAPNAGYRYEGLYYVEDAWHEIGKSGFLIQRYRLVRDPAFVQVNVGLEGQPAPRRLVTTQRIIRNTAAASKIKSLYDDRCQVCSVRILTPGGPYSERAHIQPLAFTARWT